MLNLIIIHTGIGETLVRIGQLDTHYTLSNSGHCGLARLGQNEHASTLAFPLQYNPACIKRNFRQF